MTLASSTPPSSIEAGCAALMVTDIPASHVRVPYFRRMLARLQAQGLPCRLEIDGQRYPGRAAMEAVRSGAARMAWVNASHLEAIDTALGALNLPFFLDDAAMAPPGRADAVLRLIDEVTTKQGLRTLGLMRGADQLFASRRPLRGTMPEALQGLRVRVAGPGIYEDIMRALDARPVPLAIPRIRQALADGQLDALFTSPGGWQDQLGLDAPCALRVTGLMMITYVLLVDAAWFDALPAPVQATLRDAADVCVTREWQAMAHDDEQVLAAMAQAGARIAMADALDVWRAKLAPLRDRQLARHAAFAEVLQAATARY